MPTISISLNEGELVKLVNALKAAKVTLRGDVVSTIQELLQLDANDVVGYLDIIGGPDALVDMEFADKEG